MNMYFSWPMFYCLSPWCRIANTVAKQRNVGTHRLRLHYNTKHEFLLTKPEMDKTNGKDFIHKMQREFIDILYKCCI